jgi:outer membrane usher protein
VRFRLSFAVALALAGSATHAQQVSEAFSESIVEVTINGEHLASPLVVRRDADGTLLVRADDLKALRVKTPPRGAMTVNGQLYYRIGSEIGANVSFVEAGVFGSKGVVTASAVARTGPYQPGGVRLDTAWTRDFADRMETLRIGDSISSSGSWGRSARYAGIQYGTNFSTQPTFVTTPLLSASGDAVLPSTVEVFVNGNPVASETVQPGPFQIEGVPAVNGAGQMQVVVTDALGREQVVSQPYYAGTALLREGLTEYSVEAGAIRQDYASKSNNYGNAVGAATWRHGITDRFTAEMHGEAQAGGAAAGGASGAVQVGMLGIVSANAAVGGNGDGLGWLGGLGFESSGRALSLHARTLYASESFAQLGDNFSRVRPRSRTFGGLGFNLSRFGSLQFAYGRQSNWGAPGAQTFGFGYSLGLGQLGTLNLFANYSDSNASTTDVFLTWTMSFGERATATATLQQSAGGDSPQDGFSAVGTVQRSLPVGSGSGYIASLSSANDYHVGYAYQGHAGLVTADWASANGQDGLRVGGVGGLAITDAGVMASRRLDQSFAMVKVADYEGIQVYVDNQPVGHTDREGRVLLDRLLPYQTNQVSIDPTELPMDATISSPSMTVTPAYRSGVSVKFPVSRADSMTMRLVQVNGQPVPAGAEVMLEGNPFPVAMNGLVYVSGVGTNGHASVSWQGGNCVADFTRPAGGGPVPDLGEIACR